MVRNQFDTNTCYNKFSEIVNDAFNQSFTLTRLSRKRLKDKKWITSALKKGSAVKSKLYKKWITSRNDADEVKYKQYHVICRKVTDAAEMVYYKEMFYTKSSSVRKLWKNLSEVCSFKRQTSKLCNIPK